MSHASAPLVGCIATESRVWLAWCDLVAGDLIRAQRITGRLYEREHPGEPIHLDVMKLGRIPDGGGWRALGREATVAHKYKKVLTAFDYIHAVIDDHSPLANAFAYRNSAALKPHCPCTSNTQGTQALGPWLIRYNDEHIHTSIGTTPINPVSPA